MVLKTEVCRFSGLKIYPGHGMRLTKIDSQTYLFLSAKCKRLFNLRLRPAKLAWTTQYRKAHKKVRGVNALAMCRRRVGADWRRRRDVASSTPDPPSRGFREPSLTSSPLPPSSRALAGRRGGRRAQEEAQRQAPKPLPRQREPRGAIRPAPSPRATFTHAGFFSHAARTERVAPSVKREKKSFVAVLAPPRLPDDPPPVPRPTFAVDHEEARGEAGGPRRRARGRAPRDQGAQPKEQGQEVREME
eukprot:29793-Pelagococcus_subviridis.AAC.2